MLTINFCLSLMVGFDEIMFSKRKKMPRIFKSKHYDRETLFNLVDFFEQLIVKIEKTWEKIFFKITE